MDEIKNMLRAILGRLEEQGAEIKGINGRLDRIEQRLERVEERLDKVEQRLERVEQGQERTELVLEKLSLRSIEHESQIDALKRSHAK